MLPEVRNRVYAVSKPVLADNDRIIRSTAAQVITSYLKTLGYSTPLAISQIQELLQVIRAPPNDVSALGAGQCLLMVVEDISKDSSINQYVIMLFSSCRFMLF